jgi:[FeFe] hydrogenase H-cluster maturation GTPase HydF
MNNTPQSLRLQIGFFGRVNVGKSSLLNYITGQDAAMTSSVAGTTTDVVEQAMELLPLGPVLFLDTAGLEDVSELGAARFKRTQAALERADVVVVVTEPGVWGEPEEKLAEAAQLRKAGLIVVVNKCDQLKPTREFLKQLEEYTKFVLCGSALDGTEKEKFLESFKTALSEAKPAGVEPPLLGDLVPAGGLVVMVVPIDLQAPKGRLILPQVQAIRDCLDNDASVLVVKERELASALNNLKHPPDLVVCDSQVVLKAAADTPVGIKLTTFSILFSRFKGDLISMARGAAMLHRLQAGDKVLVAEACTHHALADDIGRVKIPRWMRKFTGLDLDITHVSHHDYPADLADYRLVVHCGACMLNRHEMISRLRLAVGEGVPITNYGIAISVLQGVAERALAPFPAALRAYQETLKSKQGVQS